MLRTRRQNNDNEGCSGDTVARVADPSSAKKKPTNKIRKRSTREDVDIFGAAKPLSSECPTNKDVGKAIKDSIKKLDIDPVGESIQIAFDDVDPSTFSIWLNCREHTVQGRNCQLLKLFFKLVDIGLMEKTS